MSWLTEEQQSGLKLCFRVKKKIVSKKSKFQKIDIVATDTHGLVMALDQKIMLTEKDEFIYHEMIAHIPLFCAKNAKSILIIGGGDGGTARECLKHSYLENIDLCEIDKDVIELSKKYLPFTGKYLNDKKVNIFVEDGFKFLKNKENHNKYDVIIVDSTDPVGMAAVLFEKPFFKLLKGALKEGGIISSQCESPFFFSSTITKVKNNLSGLFKNVKFYTAPVTTYPSGYWSFCIASDVDLELNEKLYRKNAKQYKCEFYNDSIHKACFALPNFFLKLLEKTAGG